MTNQYDNEKIIPQPFDDGSLTFTCGDTAPESDITVKILII